MGLCYNQGMQTRDWRWKFDREMRMAAQARAQGNEGKARVCARRAAGIVAAAYMKRRGVATPHMTAYDRVKFLRTWPDLPPGVTEVIDHMTLRVNENYELPVDVDLVAEAQWLAETLLGEA